MGGSANDSADIPLGDGAAAAVAALIEVMARLRAGDGCPWDRKQTWKSLRRYVLEEAHELVDAVDRGDPAAVREECGDLLLEVVFMAQIAFEEGRFGMAEVAGDITEKLVRRHPHVFGDREPARGAREALASWEAVKAAEKAARAAPADGVPTDRLPPGLPALLVALKVIERREADPARSPAPGSDLAGALQRFEAARAGGSPDRLESALGDLLFAAAGEAHRRGLDPEAALRAAVRRAAGAA